MELDRSKKSNIVKHCQGYNARKGISEVYVFFVLQWVVMKTQDGC